MKKAIKDKIEELRKYFEKQKDVLLAFVFGSYAQGGTNKESDVDIGLYLRNEKENDKIESALARILERETDVIYFNDAPASLVSHIFKTGIPLTVKDKGLYWDFYLSKSAEAEDFVQFAEEYWEIYKKAKTKKTEMVRVGKK